VNSYAKRGIELVQPSNRRHEIRVVSPWSGEVAQGHLVSPLHVDVIDLKIAGRVVDDPVAYGSSESEAVGLADPLRRSEAIFSHARTFA